MQASPAQLGKKFSLLLLAVGFLCLSISGMGAEKLPAKPEGYFNDYTKSLPAPRAKALNEKLAQFERDTSIQFVVAVYPKLNTERTIEDYCNRIAKEWKIGQAGTNNGLILFVFLESKKMRFEIGYGLEGQLPDSLAHSIQVNEIVPHFKNKDYIAGLESGVAAAMSATRGDYKNKGTGKTVAEATKKKAAKWWMLGLVVGALVLLYCICAASSRRSRRHGFWSCFGDALAECVTLPLNILSSGGGGSSSSSCSSGGGDFGGGGSSADW